MTLKTTFFCIIVLFLESNLCPQKATLLSKQFQCKNFTVGEKEGIPGLLLIFLIYKARPLIICYSVFQSLSLV